LKYTIRNLRFQPITLALAGGGSIHLAPREAKTIAAQHVSAEMKRADERGFVELAPVLQEVQNPAPEIAIQSEPETKPRRK
jgi:hypothetical protein